MAKLTDIVNAKDVYNWVKSAEHSRLNPSEFATDIFMEEMKDTELIKLHEVLVSFGFNRGETGALLSFLDGAIRACQKKVSQR